MSAAEANDTDDGGDVESVWDGDAAAQDSLGAAFSAASVAGMYHMLHSCMSNPSLTPAWRLT